MPAKVTCRVREMMRAASRTSATISPSRRSPSSTMRTMPWVSARLPAATDKAVTMPRSLTMLDWALATARSAQSGAGARSSVSGHPDARVAHGLEILDAGVGQALHPAADHGAGHLGRTERGLGDSRDADAALLEGLHQFVRVVFDRGEVDLDAGRNHLISDALCERGQECREGVGHHPHQFAGLTPQGVGGGDAELGLIQDGGRVHLGRRHPFVINSQSNHSGLAKGLDQRDLAWRPAASARRGSPTAWSAPARAA